MADYEFSRYMIENDFSLSADHPYRTEIPTIASSSPNHSKSDSSSALRKIASYYNSSDDSIDCMVDKGFQEATLARAKVSPSKERDSLIEELHLCLSHIPAASDDFVFFDKLMSDEDDFEDGNFVGNIDDVVDDEVEVPVIISAAKVDEAAPMIVVDRATSEESPPKMTLFPSPQSFRCLQTLSSFSQVCLHM